MHGGHYTSSVKAGDSWFYCNDSSVYEIGEEKVQNKNAYLLVYRRKGLTGENLASDLTFNTGEKKFFVGEPVLTREGLSCVDVVRENTVTVVTEQGIKEIRFVSKKKGRFEKVFQIQRY